MSGSMSGSRSGSRSNPPDKKTKKTHIFPIFTEILWGIELEYNGVRVCNNKDYVNKVRPIYQAFCNQTKTRCKLNVTTELHKNDKFDDMKDKCFYIEFQIGIMKGFYYELFKKCCDQFEEFIKCVTKIHNTDIPFILSEEYGILYYFDEIKKVQKWPYYLSNKDCNPFIQSPYSNPSTFPRLINTEYKQTGKPQLTMSMSIAEFPLVYFMYFRIDSPAEVQTNSVYESFVKSLKKTLSTFEIDDSDFDFVFTLENFNTLNPSEFRAALIKCRDNILKATSLKYAESDKEFKSKWESSDRLFGELLSFWGFILYINMYIKSHNNYETKYKYCCLPKDGQSEPIMTAQEFVSKNYFKSFFSLKPRTKIYLLYSKLSKLLQEIISKTKDCDLFEGCCVSYKEINFKGAKILTDDDNPHDIFEFTEKQNVPYQITVEFRSFLLLFLSSILEPSHPWFFGLTNLTEYSTKLYKLVTREEEIMGYPLKEIMGYPTENRTVDIVKKYTIAILEFYKPLFQQYSNSEEDEEEKTLEAKQTYTTSFTCEEDKEEKKPESLWEKLTGIFTPKKSLPVYFKNKKISKHKSSSKKIKKSYSKYKSTLKKIKSQSKRKSTLKKIKSQSKRKSTLKKIKSQSKRKSSLKKIKSQSKYKSSLKK
jgi:hypothetical protein